GQKRKGTETPYIVHPVGVAMLLAQAGCRPEVVAAGLLHDTIEDCGVTASQLASEFGAEVADIVVGCSEPERHLPWEERKAHTFTYLRSAPLEIKLVACADKLNNVRAMRNDLAAHGEAFWKRFKRGRDQQAWYYRGLVEAFRPEIQAGTCAPLFAALEHEVTALFGG
ncbi:MAG TPA: HD domain-containing protein, partial [Symbiobacteriaceae bacterium]|nr:HD domain-containing protein [Symbiobacteriaceae bacterium]